MKLNVKDVTVNKQTFTAYQVTLTPIAREHQHVLRQWRNDPEIQQQMFSSNYITEEQQLAWFDRINDCNTQWHWIVSYKGEFIGSTNIKVIEKGQSVVESQTLEAGLYIGDARYKGNVLAFAPTLAMYDFCFENLATKAFKALVKTTNSAAINYNQKLGYKIQGQSPDTDVCEMILTEQDYQLNTTVLKQLLSRAKKQ